MNERELGRRIAHRLNDSLDRLDSAKLDRLKRARMAALARHRETAPVLVWAGGLTGSLARLLPQRPALWVPIVALLLTMSGVGYWQTRQQTDNDEIDAAVGLLSSDLPLRAYTDPDFDTWLKVSSP